LRLQRVDLNARRPGLDPGPLVGAEL